MTPPPDPRCPGPPLGSRPQSGGAMGPLPYLPDNTPASCPVTAEELSRFLAAEGASLSSDELAFVRTARLEDKQYWLWRYPAGQGAGYATVVVEPEGSTWLRHHAQQPDAAPEQVLLADYQSGF